MNSNGLFEIALFPIPGLVSFPHTIVPLHVFEPRYREMIQNCIDKNRLLGVCHTQSIERFANSVKMKINTIEEAYSFYKQNLSTYTPQEIFSAGTVDITEKTEDGRYLVSIQMLKRFRIVKLVQKEPYKIGVCEEYQDKFESNFRTVDKRYTKQKVLMINYIKDQFISQGLKVDTELDDLYQENSVNSFSFKIFRYLRLKEFKMQQILQSTDPLSRLEDIYKIIQSLPPSR